MANVLQNTDISGKYVTWLIMVYDIHETGGDDSLLGMFKGTGLY